MGRRNKLKKFAEILSFDHVFENYDPTTPQLTGKDGKPVDNKGQWKKSVFRNANPLVLELCCGRGEYTVALAAANPDVNYMGVDIKGARIWEGAVKALEANLTNVVFLRTRIEQTPLFLDTAEADEIWITFPDPFLKEVKQNRRLTSPPFLDRYRNFLKPGGIVHLKTDSSELYEFTLEVLLSDPRANILYRNDDIYGSQLLFPELEYKTYYEKKHLSAGKKITYIRFTIH